MTSRDFCYWLQGYFEVSGRLNAGLDAAQTDMVKRHLAMVFVHEIDPSFPADQQDKLNEVHVGPNPQTTTMVSPPKIGGHSPDGTLYRC